MPTDSNGTYTAPVNSFDPAVTDTIIDPADWNDTQDDYVSALTDRLDRTGKGTMQADLAMSTHSIVLAERTAPSSPAADNIALYAKDVTGTTHLFTKNSAGTEVDISLGASAIGGSTGATDNRLLRADGTGGSTLQNSTILVDDSGNTSGIGTLATSGAITQNSVAVVTVGASGVQGQTLVSGYALTIYDYGNKAAASTITVDPSLGQHQKAALTSTGGTAVTILAPTVEGECILKILNNSGGTVTTPTFSGFDKVLSGSNTFATGNTKINWIFIYNIDGLQAYTIQNMN